MMINMRLVVALLFLHTIDLHLVCSRHLTHQELEKLEDVILSLAAEENNSSFNDINSLDAVLSKEDSLHDFEDIKSDRNQVDQKRQNCLSLTQSELVSVYGTQAGESSMYAATNEMDAVMFPNLLWDQNTLQLYNRLINALRSKMKKWVDKNDVTKVNAFKRLIEQRLNISLSQSFAIGSQSNSKIKRAGKSKVCINPGSQDVDTKNKYLCKLCAEETTLPTDRFPQYINEVTCADKSPCLSGGGSCKQNYIFLKFLKKTGKCKTIQRDGKSVLVEEWTTYRQKIRTSCECQVNPTGKFSAYVR